MTLCLPLFLLDLFFISCRLLLCRCCSTWTAGTLLPSTWPRSSCSSIKVCESILLFLLQRRTQRQFEKWCHSRRWLHRTENSVFWPTAVSSSWTGTEFEVHLIYRRSFQAQKAHSHSPATTVPGYSRREIWVLQEVCWCTPNPQKSELCPKCFYFLRSRHI